MTTKDDLTTPLPNKRNKIHSAIFFPLIILFTAWLYLPYVEYGLPYFYDEDEGHHYDRVVDMVKEGTFNPKYFSKPSLHFYLRMPVTALAFLHLAKKGEIRSVQDIRTKDAFSLAGRSFTASHPFIAKANRVFSLLLTLISIGLVFLICYELTASSWLAGAGALISAFSPSLAERSAFIGVDGPMMLFCLLCVYLAIKLQKKFSTSLLCFCAISAGLAISCKYNAAPIFFLPLIAAYLSGHRKPLEISLAVFLPIISFLITSPFILVSLPLFLDHLGYEMWHYKSGHIGHSAEPGLSQAVFYLNWLWHDGWGVILCAALCGGIYFILKDRITSVILLFFPVVYGFLMVMQRVNFERNMLVELPFLAILSILSFSAVLNLLKTKKQKLYLILLFFILTAYPCYLTIQNRTAAAADSDSRDLAYNWLLTNKDPHQPHDIALAGDLGLPRFTTTSTATGRMEVVTLKGIKRMTLPDNIFLLYQKGFDRIVTSPKNTFTDTELSLMNLKASFKGESEQARVYHNPEINIFDFKKDPQSRKSIRQLLLKNNLVSTIEPTPAHNSKENYIWLQERLTKVSPIKVHKLQVFTPWLNQRILILDESGSEVKTITDIEPNTWTSVTLPKTTSGVLLFEINELHSLADYDFSLDKRRLGAALKFE